MEYTQIRFDVSERIATLTLDRPEARNAFSDVMREEIRDALARVDADRDIRVLVLAGAGGAFCAGGDVKLMISRMESGLVFEERRAIFRRDVAAVVRQIDALRIPIIAAVNGAAYGAGASLALLCDIRVAAASAKFGFLFGKRGLIPDWGANHTLPRAVGYARALELVAAGGVVTAAEALACGLVSRVVADGALADSVRALAAAIAANSPSAVAESKRALRLGMRQTLPDALEHEATTQSILQLSEDHREGVRAFVEKREPIF